MEEVKKALRERILSAELTRDQLGIFYLGQEGFVFKFRGKYVLVDCYLSGKVVKDKTEHGRFYPAPIEPEALDFVDYIFCSHEHGDHTDMPALKRILAANEKAVIVLPAAYLKNVVEGGLPEERILPAHDGKVLSFGDITVEPLPAAHEELHTDENGDYYEMGYRFDFGGKMTLYHSGDSCVFDGLKERVGKIDLAFLPINGRSYYRYNSNIIGNMNLEEALTFARDAQAKLFVPMHFDLFPFNCVPASYIPAAVEQYAEKMPYKIFQPGEGIVYMNLD